MTPATHSTTTRPSASLRSRLPTNTALFQTDVELWSLIEPIYGGNKRSVRPFLVTRNQGADVLIEIGTDACQTGQTSTLAIPRSPSPICPSRPPHCVRPPRSSTGNGRADILSVAWTDARQALRTPHPTNSHPLPPPPKLIRQRQGANVPVVARTDARHTIQPPLAHYATPFPASTHPPETRVQAS